MDFKDIWAQLVRKNAALADTGSRIEFTSGNLERLLRQVYDRGKKSVPREPASSSGLDQLKSMFGL